MNAPGLNNPPTAELIGDGGKRIAVRGEQSLGRSVANSIVVSAKEISSNHALLRWANDTLVVKDLNSSNGTTVNDERIHDECELLDGDIVCFATICYSVALPAKQSLDVTVVKPVTSQESLELSNETIVSAACLSGKYQDLGPVVVPLEIHTRGDVERASNLPHLLVLDATGQVSELLELEVGEDDRADIWEIGRNATCQITLKDDSVSSRHAQLRNENGAWILINLLATNGALVNNVKQLSATLNDGDRIRLGDVQLLFREEADQPGKTPIKPLDELEVLQLKPKLTKRRGTLFAGVTVAFVFLLLGVGALLLSLARVEAP